MSGAVTRREFSTVTSGTERKRGFAGSSYSAAKEKGLVRLEGKEYIVKDGDVILFRFLDRIQLALNLLKT